MTRYLVYIYIIIRRVSCDFQSLLRGSPLAHSRVPQRLPEGNLEQMLPQRRRALSVTPLLPQRRNLTIPSHLLQELVGEKVLLVGALLFLLQRNQVRTPKNLQLILLLVSLQ